MTVEQRTESERILAAREQFVPRGIATTPIVVARAEGAQVEDVDGKTYIDFAGGLGCQNTGHGFPAAVAAMHEQIDSYLHQCFMVGIYEPYVEVCRRLAELDRIFCFMARRSECKAKRVVTRATRWQVLRSQWQTRYATA